MLRAAAAADPGHRQCRRLHHAGRAARRQHSISPSCKSRHRRMVGNAPAARARCSASSTTFRADVPQFRVDVDRVKAETLHVSVDQVFATLSTYLGSSYVDSVQQVRPHVPGLCAGRFAVPPAPEDIAKLTVRKPERRHDPARHAGRRSRRAPGPSLISLYNLYPAATDHRPCRRAASAPARPSTLMEQIAGAHLPPGTGYRMDRDVLSGEDRRQPDLSRLRAGDAAGLSRARRAIRELVRAARRSSSRCRWRWSGRCWCSRRSASTTISTPRSA